MPEIKFTMFLCLGGTGTQIGTTIGNIYPLLLEAGIANTSSSYEMFIIDKDGKGGIFSSCIGACERYQKYEPFLPFKKLPPYKIHKRVYQELQEADDNLRNKNDYTVMDLIGYDDQIQDLAKMCWIEEKRGESIRDGNNRDPSRGSLDAQVCLKKFDKCTLYQRLNEATRDDCGIGGVRVVILGGATGGMGSSLILPLAKKIRSYFPGLRIDMVLLGTYFAIPSPPLQQQNKINDIGNTQDSFYRAAAQIQELKEELVDGNPEPWVYYAAIPEFDNTCGEFNKNGAVKRASHLLELIAALAAFKLKDEKPGFYQTSIVFDKENPKAPNIDWDEKIPYIEDLKKPAWDLMLLFSIIVCQVIPRFTLNEDEEILAEDIKRMEKDLYVKLYIKKPKEKKEQERIKKICGEFKKIKENLIPYFNLWNEIQLYTKFGMNSEIIEFFSREEMKKLAEILGNTKEVTTNEIRLYQRWANFFPGIKTKAATLAQVLEADDTEGLVKLMISDIYEVIKKRKED